MPTPKGTKPWNAGTAKGWVDKRGYRWIRVTENGKRRAKREHRHVMEQSLGRALHPEELVHHINDNRSDNRIENLEILQWGEHTAYHHNGTHRTEQHKRMVQVMANYREDHKRLTSVNAELLQALQPFADVAPELHKIGAIARKDQWLWKPSSNTRETKGINAQHILDAVAALSKAERGADK